MPRPAQFRPLPLPWSWPRRVRSAVVRIVSLARTSLALTEGWASESMNPELRQQAEGTTTSFSNRSTRERHSLLQSTRYAQFLHSCYFVVALFWGLLFGIGIMAMRSVIACI
jgi:hypothetical protein